VSARKQMLASKHERTAALALDELLHRLETRPGEIPTPVLNIIGGTSTDKCLALRGDSVSTIRHLHDWVDLTNDDILAFAVAISPNKTKDEGLRNRIKEIGIDGFARVRRKLLQQKKGAASPKVIEAEIVTDQEGG